MNIIKNKRIGQLEFKHSTYLLPRNKWPNPIEYEIVLWYPNYYYKKEKDYIDCGDHYKLKDENGNPVSHIYISKSCFKHKESCYTLVSFYYNEHEGYYELYSCGDRILNVPKEAKEDFWTLIEYAFKKLNKSCTI